MRTRTAERTIPQDDRPVAAAAPDPRRFGRGQMMVIFAGAMVALMLLMAMVVDIGWYWSSGLRIQRAADAAALAGAVYLPDNFNGATPNAQSAALAAAARNGYVPDADTSLVSAIDDNNPRQLDVTINDRVGTFFLKVVGIKTLAASRTSKAEFVLPVPMGSPLNYYGVGTSMGTTLTPHTTHTAGTGNSGPRTATNVPAGGTWTASSGALDAAVAADDGLYARTSTNSAAQLWGSFGLTSQLAANQTITSVDGIRVQINDLYLSAACANTFLYAALSWNAGSSWTNTATQTGNLDVNPTTGDYLLGSATSLAAWGGHTWVAADLTDANFRVAVQASKGCSTSGREIRLDQLRITVNYHIDSTTTTTTMDDDPTPRVVPDPLTATALATQGFWGAVITKGGDRTNGDQFDVVYDYTKNAANPDYDGKGVDYTVVIAGPGGQVRLFDPEFCETGVSTGGGNYGLGDHWIGGSPNNVSTVFALFDQNGTPYDTSDDVQKATSGADFVDEQQADYSGRYGVPAHAGLTDCGSDPYHNAWYTLASGLPAGNYRLNVSTNLVGNNATNAENMWSAWVKSSSGNSQVFGQGKMVAYNNLAAGKQLFYLAQIDKVHAGKTMEIKLFDPGDVSGDASLKIMSPDGNAYNYVSNFTWTSDNNKSGVGPVIQTASSSSGSFFQDSVVTIEIPLPITYGSGGLTPPSETAYGPGWWKIEYTVAGGNDTTSWQVDITGNPVHLLVP